MKEIDNGDDVSRSGLRTKLHAHWQMKWLCNVDLEYLSRERTIVVR